MKWYEIASERVDPIWWDTVLTPLKELESGATGGVIHLEKDDVNAHEKEGAFKTIQPSAQKCIQIDSAMSPGKVATEVPKEPSKKLGEESSATNPFVATRSSIEDLELETRALTEPLPTNQQVNGFICFCKCNSEVIC